ncbi:MAG TPA: energy-coupling factor transporter ATPase [Bacillota bacterium]|nr:energy-coupling factor transporter ATPase [Bacillota bacterium]
MDPLVVFNQVNFAYPQKPEELILKQVSLTVSQGEFVTIIGHNGSGKSTLAKHMNGLLLPTNGQVFIDSIDTLDQDTLWNIRQRVGIVFQNPDNQFVAPTVYDDVGFGLENLGISRQEMIVRIEEALQQVSMAAYKDREPHRLSGGQKQRVAIAGILAMKPKLIVLDESTAMLDPIGRKEVLSVVDSLHKEGITIINITHYLEEALSSDRIIVMNRGEIFLQGTPLEVFSHSDELRKIGLDVPFSVEMAIRLRKRGLTISKEIWRTDQLVTELWNLL